MNVAAHRKNHATFLDALGARGQGSVIGKRVEGGRWRYHLFEVEAEVSTRETRGHSTENRTKFEKQMQC